MTSGDQARIYFAKADEDIHVLQTLCSDPATSDAIWGFHAQQAVEKLLKAALSSRGTRFPFTHRLLDLADLLSDAGCPIPQEAEALLDLTPFAVEFRYSMLSSMDEPPLDRPMILHAIKEFRAHTITTTRLA